MKDKLIELLSDAPYGLRTLGQAADELISVESIADHLIASGVTFVTDNVFVVDLQSQDCVFNFQHFGWEMVLDLLRYIGCNAEEV